MAAVVWLKAALDDLDAIAEYIAEDSPSFASAVVQKALTASRNLSRFPTFGSQVAEWGDENLRQLLVYSYRIIYRIELDKVVILAVIHGARLLPDEVKDR